MIVRETGSRLPVRRRRRGRGACALVLLVSAAGASAQTIRIQRVGVVTDEFIRIADVAVVTGLDAASTEAIGNLRIVKSPVAGASRVLPRDPIRATLRAGGVNFAALSLMGATRCEVSRPAEMPEATQADVPRAGESRVPLAPKTRRDRTQPVTLGDAIRGYLDHSMAEYGGDVVVSLPARIQDALSLSTPEYNFRIRATDDRKLGMVGLEVEVRRGGRLEQTLPVVADVMLTKKVVVTRRGVNRNAVVTEKDLTFAERTFTRVADIPESEPAALIGNKARRFVPTGDLIRVGDVMPLTLVERNDRVSITVRRGRVNIQTVAKAREAGGYGDVIEVMNEASRKNYFVRITGPGTAELTTAPPRKLAALADRRFSR
jgi:flagella basal body P-ring formation protein FlgA